MKRITFDGLFCDIAQCQYSPGGSYCESGTCSQRQVWGRLKAIEDILGDEYDLDQFRELLQAKGDGRLVVLREGVTVRGLQEEYRKNKHMADEQLPSPSYTTGRLAGFGAGVIHILDKILPPPEEAEAALAAQKGDAP